MERGEIEFCLFVAALALAMPIVIVCQLVRYTWWAIVEDFDDR